MNPMLLTGDGRWMAVDGVGRFSRGKVTPPARPLARIGQLLEPKSAAVVGASSKGMNPGRIILRNLKAAQGIRYGHLYAIHPKEEAIEGVPCVRSLEELPEKVDLVVVSIPAEGARDAIRAVAEKDLAASIILIPGGFAETGSRGLEEEIIGSLDRSRSNPGGGPVLVGGNCLGIVSKFQYNTFFLPQYKLPFHNAPGESLVAISQSGAYLVTLTSNLDGILFPRASISYGNQMDLTVSDFLEYFLDVEEVKVLPVTSKASSPWTASGSSASPAATGRWEGGSSPSRPARPPSAPAPPRATPLPWRGTTPSPARSCGTRGSWWPRPSTSSRTLPRSSRSSWNGRRHGERVVSGAASGSSRRRVRVLRRPRQALRPRAGPSLAGDPEGPVRMPAADRPRLQPDRRDPDGDDEPVRGGDPRAPGRSGSRRGSGLAGAGDSGAGQPGALISPAPTARTSTVPNLCRRRCSACFGRAPSRWSPRWIRDGSTTTS